jgi:hypothetical protein
MNHILLVVLVFPVLSLSLSLSQYQDPIGSMWSLSVSAVGGNTWRSDADLQEASEHDMNTDTCQRTQKFQFNLPLHVKLFEAFSGWPNAYLNQFDRRIR